MTLLKKAYRHAFLGTVCMLCLLTGGLVWLSAYKSTIGNSKDQQNDYVLEPSISKLGKYTKTAVATPSPHCSTIGKDILEIGGSVADATIAAALCVGLIQSQSMGLGGGFVLVMYNATTKQATTLNARERAPAAASKNMFAGDPLASSRGSHSVAVPGELKGYWELHQKHGKLPWKLLFQRTIKLAREGFKVTPHAASSLYCNSKEIKASPSLAEVFVDNQTGEVYRENETMTRTDLADTLEQISNEGDLLYRNTTMMRDFVNDLQDEGGILTENDMLDYKVTCDETVQMNLTKGFTIHSIPPPGSGILLAFILKLMSFYDDLEANSLVTYQRLVESFKHTYAKRTFLGDLDTTDEMVKAEIEQLQNNLSNESYIEEILDKIRDNGTSEDLEYYGAHFYQPDDHGTAHISVIGPSGDAIAFTSTINLLYGSRIRSRKTGIIYNDEMDDFSNPNVINQFGVPASRNNFIEPGRRPASSMSPAIFTDERGNVRLVIGGAGGTKITTSVAYVALRNLWFGDTIKKAIDARRIHHQLMNGMEMVAEYEKDFNPRIVQGLQRIGHKTAELPLGISTVQGIAVDENGTVFANADFRKPGTVNGF